MDYEQDKGAHLTFDNELSFFILLKGDTYTYRYGSSEDSIKVIRGPCIVAYEHKGDGATVYDLNDRKLWDWIVRLLNS